SSWVKAGVPAWRRKIFFWGFFRAAHLHRRCCKQLLKSRVLDFDVRTALSDDERRFSSPGTAQRAVQVGPSRVGYVAGGDGRLSADHDDGVDPAPATNAVVLDFRGVAGSLHCDWRVAP